jgi:uncharacterized protein YbjT (DUF2867 family)
MSPPIVDRGVPPRRVFVTGGTGFIGRHLIPALLRRGHSVTALARPGSEKRLPPGCAVRSGNRSFTCSVPPCTCSVPPCTWAIGNPLDGETYRGEVPPADTFVHLVGVSHPSPAKANLFRSIDLASLRAAVAVAVSAGIGHFVYVSVAQPAPVMQAYVAARREGERILMDSGLRATILRPWYVLGPGRRWPLLLTPLYRLLESLPSTREKALRLGLVTLSQMIGALLAAVEHPYDPACDGIAIVEVPQIRKMAPLSRPSEPE